MVWHWSDLCFHFDILLILLTVEILPLTFLVNLIFLSHTFVIFLWRCSSIHFNWLPFMLDLWLQGREMMEQFAILKMEDWSLVSDYDVSYIFFYMTKGVITYFSVCWHEMLLDYLNEISGYPWIQIVVSQLNYWTRSPEPALTM